ncbi:hypothetical protein VR46_29260, partial [Streptomyces sp. NRRL S-444]
AQDTAHTAQEVADVAVPRLADFALVDLLDPPPRGDEPSAGPASGPVPVRRAAVRSVLEGNPESQVAVGGTTSYPALSPPAQCLATGRGAVYGPTDPALAQWVAEDERAAAWISEYGTHSVMVVPLQAGGLTLGVAVFGRHRRSEPFLPEDLQLAEELATRAAVSIHDAHGSSREHTSTMTLQRSLLPHTLPTQAALEIASRYLPAGTAAG